MKRFIFISLSLILGVALFIFVLQQVGWLAVRENLALLTTGQILLVALVSLTGFLFSVFRWRFILRSQAKSRLAFGQLLKARAAGFSLSYLTPTVYFGGEPVRALVFKEETKIDWNKNIFSVIVDKALELTINALVILIGVIYLFLYFNLPAWLKIILISVLFFCLWAIYFFYSRSLRKKGRGFLTDLIDFFWLDKIKKIRGISGDIKKIEEYIYDFFSHQPKHLIGAIFFALLSRLFSVSAAWLIVIFLGAQITLTQFLGFIALTAAIYFVPIPGALGIHEASQAVIFSLFGLGDYRGTAFSLILRMIHLSGVMIGLIILAYFQIKMWGQLTIRFLDKLGKKLTNSL
jgi:uncharacterized protein (TIRG00374 family)